MTVEAKRDSRLLYGTGTLVLLLTGLFLFGGVLAPAWALAGEAVSYNQFEADVRDGIYAEAVMDGNILNITTVDGNRLRVEAPSAPRAVELLVKFEVPVKAYRPVPASGVSWPMAILILIPYLILGFYAFALGYAVSNSPAIAVVPEEEDLAEDDRDDDEEA